MKYLKLLYVQVLIGIAAGVLVGHYFPEFAPKAKIISDTFINGIKMMIGPIIFISIVLGIAGSGSLKKVGRVGGKGLLYFEIVTTLAIIVGVIAANVIKPGAGVPLPHDAKPVVTGDAQSMDWLEFLSHIVPSNIVESFAKGEIVQILFFGVLFAIGLQKLGENGRSITAGFEKINKILFNVLHIIIKVSPLGAFGGMAFTVGKYGFASLGVLGKLLVTYYLTSLIFIFVILNLIAKFYGFSLWKLLVYIKEELLIVLGASSSESVLPNIMEKLEKAGCSKSVVGLIIPAGYSFNLDGSSIYLSLATIFLAQVFNVDMSIGQQLSVIAILMITSKGAAGVTGSGFLVLTSTLTALKIIPVEGLALLVGVDRFMSEGRALTNIIGNTVATVVIAKSEKAINTDQYSIVVEKKKAVTG
ncbi:C4-dicarboxylate transporter DctA [Ferruginibacter sp.]